MAAFSITVKDLSGNGVSDASVGIFDVNGVPIMSAVADIDGIALFVTNEPEVAVRVSKYGYIFPNNLSLLPVDNATYDIAGEKVDIAPPIDAHLCRVYGNIRDPLGGELGSRWRIKVSRVGVMGDAHSDDIVTGEAQVPHDSGSVIIDLVQGSSYRIGPLPISRYGDLAFEEMTYADINVPERPVAKLVDLVSPIAHTLTSSSLNVTTQLDQVVTENLQLELTDGTLAENIKDFVYVTTDTGNINAELGSNEIQIRGEIVGADKITLFGKRDILSALGTFYRPSTAVKLLEIEVSCVP